jgi:hypothetical protein
MCRALVEGKNLDPDQTEFFCRACGLFCLLPNHTFQAAHVDFFFRALVLSLTIPEVPV